jgi:hypothetical protein
MNIYIYVPSLVTTLQQAEGGLVDRLQSYPPNKVKVTYSIGV